MEIRVQIRKSGRLVVPVKLRKALNIKAGDEILARLENDSIRLIPVQQAVNLAQKVVRQYVPQGVSLVDELIKARREEARGK
ncbi:MAG: AbrB/MazE/SpoVT family DNA-binding domain-containing protein [Candidatus Atribacteria bacterium]|nr:AbrB/MazE/SpoVT family DNA-binding domain-containing protein [Candidatus Atribacteria bacterium]